MSLTATIRISEWRAKKPRTNLTKERHNTGPKVIKPTPPPAPYTLEKWRKEAPHYSGADACHLSSKKKKNLRTRNRKARNDKVNIRQFKVFMNISMHI